MRNNASNTKYKNSVEKDFLPSRETKSFDIATAPVENPCEDGPASSKISSRKNKNSKKFGKGLNPQNAENSSMPNLEDSVPSSSQMRDGTHFSSEFDGIGTDKNENNRSQSTKDESLTGENFPSLTTLTSNVLGKVKEWMWNQRPWINKLGIRISKSWNIALKKIGGWSPILVKWISQVGKFVLVLFMVWLDCILRGLDSLLRLGTTSLFMVIWCCVLSAVVTVGLSKIITVVVCVNFSHLNGFLIMLMIFSVLWIQVISGLVFLFIGLPFCMLVLGISMITLLWVYGSFWTTGFIILIGGLLKFLLLILKIFSNFLTFLFNRNLICYKARANFPIYCYWIFYVQHKRVHRLVWPNCGFQFGILLR